MVQYMEWLKAFLFGIVEGITEWLPISSTGHMILLNEFVKLDVSDAFYKMFQVVIQLGAILAVVVLFWNQIWPLKRNHGRHGGASITNRPRYYPSVVQDRCRLHSGRGRRPQVERSV